MSQRTVITVLGSAGGVAKAVLSLLNKAAQDSNDPIHAVIRNCQLHLIDRKQKSLRYYRNLLPALAKSFVLHQFHLQNLQRFREHLRQTGTNIVVDVSWADTVDILRCCNALGVRYANTALESTVVDENWERSKGFPLLERVMIFEKNRPDFTNTTAIICSGMNPGVVQWMALELMKQNPGRTPLGCYVVERDTSFYANKALADKDTLYTTWSPECFLDEAILSLPMFMSHRTPVFLQDTPYALDFKVSLGKTKFKGSLMPHEEVYSLCRLYDMEGGFIYRVNDHTTTLIRDKLDSIDDVWDLDMVVLDPADGALKGEDLVGVLLVYEEKEHYMFNVKSNREVFARYGVNATYFQVACGMYAALATLLLDTIPPGVYCVDDLLLTTQSRYGTYASYYLTDFAVGENAQSEGLLLERMTRVNG